MYGAIIGDIAGSRYEFNPVKTKDVPLFGEDSYFTDDTVLTIAVANALLEARETGASFKELLVPELESGSYEDAIRNAISLGGDADTQAAIAGSIAWSYYRFDPECAGSMLHAESGRIWPPWCQNMVEGNRIDDYLPADFVSTIERFDDARMRREGAYARLGLGL